MKQFFFAFLLLATLSAFGQHQPFSAKLDSLMQLYEQEKNFSGVVMVSQKANTLYARSFGYADRERQVLNQVNTNFNIASVGKTFTGVMIMQLVQEGKLKLTDTISRILTEYKIPKGNDITVMQLLTHTSGINNYMQHPKFDLKRKYLQSLHDVMHLVIEMPPTMEKPGQRFDYANSGFITLGRIIEVVSGKDYIINLQERIFSRAGIDNSYINYPARFNAPKEAVPYFASSKKSFRNGISEEFPAFSDGGMQSNAMDLTRFANGLLQGTLLNRDARKLLWTGRSDMGPGGKYALGWIENENPYGKHIISHDGGGKGFSTDLKIVEDDEYVIVVLINNRVNPRDISNNILKLLYTGTYDKPQKALENVVFEQIETKGWNVVKNEMQNILAERHMTKVPSVWFYIRLMEMLDENGRSATALELLQLANQDFPKATGPYIVAAQIVEQKGDKIAAKKYYKKALDIDPKDEFAKSGLAALKKKK